MSNFDELYAQATAGRPGASSTAYDPNMPDVFEQAGLPPVATPIADGLEEAESTLFGRIGDAYDKRVTSVVDTIAGLTGLEQQQQETLMGRDMTPEEINKVDPGFVMGVTQLAGDTAGLVWDAAGETVATTAVEGFRLLPDNVQGAAAEQFNILMQSPEGQAALSALSQGQAAWDAFSAQYPQEAKTIGAIMNIAPFGKVGKVKVPVELTPLKLNRVGGRKVLSPPKGRDKDVYNLITPEVDKQARLTALQEGRVEPSRLSSNSTVPSDKEWEIVDAVKTLPVDTSKSNIKNSDTIFNEIVSIDDRVIGLARGTRGGVPDEVLNQNIQSKIAAARAENPAIFGSQKPKGTTTQQDLIAQFQKYVDENGNSYEGILRSRQQFDSFMDNKMKAGTWSGKKADVAGGIHTAIRDAANDLVKDAVPGAGDLLKRSHLLHEGWKPIAAKASTEAQGALGRVMQAINMRLPETPMSQATTFTTRMGLLGIAGNLAISPFVLSYKYGVKPLTKNRRVQTAKGTFEYTIRDIVREAQKAVKLINDPVNKKALLMDIKYLTILANSLENAEYPEDVDDTRPQ